MSNRAILSVKYTPAGAAAGKAVGGFLRYVQYRDQHEVGERSEGIGGLVRYVAYRDRAAPEGRLFDAKGTIGDRERKRLVDYVNRSLRATSDTGRSRRAVYRMVLSPEDARGLDLRRLTRSVMEQLARDAGPGGLSPWVAAEHRNTAHPHVHIVMAAFRETSPGVFRGLVVNRERLARMKTALGFELELQLGRTRGRSLSEVLLETARPRRREPDRWARHDQLRWQQQSSLRPLRPLRLQRLLRRLAARYQLEVELEMRRRDREQVRGRDRGRER